MIGRRIAILLVTIATAVFGGCRDSGGGVPSSPTTTTPTSTAPAPTASPTAMPRFSPTPLTIGPAGREKPATPDIAELVIADADGQDQRLALYLTEPITGLTWSPDGRYLAYLKSHQWLETYDVETGTLTRIAHPFGYGQCEGYDWSWDGTMIACVSGPDVLVIYPDGRDARLIMNVRVQGDYGDRMHIDLWGWSPGSPTLAYSISTYDDSKPSELYIAGPSREPAIILQSPNSIDAAAWSPDGQQLLVVTVSHGGTPERQPRPQAHILLVAVGDGSVREIAQMEAFINSASWSHDGRWIALDASEAGERPDNGAYVVEVATGAIRHIALQNPGLGDLQCCPAWSGDDQVLLVLNPPWESVYEGAFLIGVQGGDRIPLPRHYYEAPPAWSPDGREMLLGDDALVVAGKDGKTSQLLAEADKTYFSAVWSPKGDKIAFVRAPTANYVYSVRPDGSDLRRESPLDTGWLANRGATMQADSPDGRTRVEVRGDGLYLVDKSSGGDISLAASFKSRVAFDSTASWSPDGSRIAFRVTPQQPYQAPGIFVASRDGSNITQVTQSGLYGHLLVGWSSDGERILFAVAWPLGP